MRHQRPIIALGVAIIMIAAQMMSPPLWLSLLVLVVGVMIAMWGFARDQMNATLLRLPGGSMLVQGFERLEAALEDDLSQERRRLVNDAFARLTTEDIQWLHKMSVGGRPIGMPGNVSNSIGNAGLLEYDFTGVTGIRAELKPFVDEKLKDFPTLRRS